MTKVRESAFDENSVAKQDGMRVQNCLHHNEKSRLLSYTPDLRLLSKVTQMLK